MTRASRRKYHIVYSTTCLATGKFYIGMHSTDNLDDGYLGPGTRLVRSVKKYGAEQHRREVLLHFSSRLEAAEAEEVLIAKVIDDPMCMNIMKSAAGYADRSATTEEHRARQSEASKKMWASEEYRAAHSLSMEEVCASEEYRASISASLKKHWEENRERRMKIFESEEYRASMSAMMYDRWQTEEYRANRAAAFARPEVQERRSKAQREASNRPEVIAKKNTPEARAKRSASMKKHWEDPEARAKRSMAMKKMWEARRLARGR